jgi:amino acid transporter
MRDPIRTIKKAAPIAISAIAITYFLVNVAYFIVVDKSEILTSGQAVT